MNVTELAAACVRQINLAGNNARVCLVLPGRWGKRDTRRLCPGGPIGEITGEAMGESRPSLTVHFGAMDILAFLTARGLIEAVGPDGRSLGPPAPSPALRTERRQEGADPPGHGP